MNMATVSTTVVMSGAAMSAGSRPSFFAATGKSPPVTLAQATVHMSASDTTAASRASPYLSMMTPVSTSASAVPTTSDTRSSFHSIASVSEKCSSSTARPRIMSVELCEPQLPPVSIIIGMNATSSGTAANAASYLEIMAPVMPADTISTSSHTMRCFACFHTGVLR